MRTQTQPERASNDEQLVKTAAVRVLRIMHYPIDEARRSALQKAFGNVEITTLSEFRFGDDPAAEVLELVQQFGDVVAVELVGPTKVLAKITAEKNRFDGIRFIKAEFVRGDMGRPAAMGLSPTTGEDVLLFDHYEVLEKVEYVTSLLIRD